MFPIPICIRGIATILIPALERFNVRAMAIGTDFTCRLVKQNRLPLHLALQRMAHRASYIGVCPRQGELGAFIMIENRGCPTLNDMTVAASCDALFGNKLTGMRIGMAGFTILRSALELNFMRSLNGLVTIPARHTAVRSDQGELRFRMVKTADIDPGPGVVAGLAAQGSSVGSLSRHTVLEFALVRIGVASRTSLVLETERQNPVGSAGQAGLVAVAAGNRHVSARENEVRVFVFGNCKR